MKKLFCILFVASLFTSCMPNDESPDPNTDPGAGSVVVKESVK